VLAELTQPFDQPDVSYFFPLMADVERRLGFRPRFGAFDAAFDAFYVYEYFHRAGEEGFAAVPFSQRGGYKKTFDARGRPLCQAGLAMPLKHTFWSKSTLVPHERGRHVCPLLFPEETGQACPIDHKQWPKGGCTTTLPTSIGARLRYQLDRDSEVYKEVYKQRTASERINSQAVELGIERPKLRNGAAIANQNSLIYVLINPSAGSGQACAPSSGCATSKPIALLRESGPIHHVGNGVAPPRDSGVTRLRWSPRLPGVKSPPIAPASAPA